MECKRVESLRLACALAIAYLLIGVSTVAAGDGTSDRGSWPSFLGPVQPNFREADLPLTWSDSDNVAWRVPIVGYGQSSPVVWDGRVFVTSISGRMKEHCHVTAYSLEDGRRLWQRDFDAATRAENTGYISKAAPTPVVDGSGLVVWFEAGNLIGLSRDGDVRWQRNLVREFGEIDARHGLGSSLARYDGNVFVWVERQTKPFLLAVDMAHGKTQWRAEGLGATSWSTPCLLAVGDETHLVLSGSGKLAGLNVQSGKRLWSFDALTGNTVPTPRPVGNGLILVGATVGEGNQPSGQAAKSNGLVQVRPREGGRYEVTYRWRSQRATSSFGSPMAHQGVAYFVNKSGVLFCLDMATGEEHYAKRIGDSVWATPVAIGDRVYCPGKGGTTVVVRAGRTFEKLAENRLGEDRAASGARTTPGRVVYALVALPSAFLVRTGGELICVRKSKQQP